MDQNAALLICILATVFCGFVSFVIHDIEIYERSYKVWLTLTIVFAIPVFLKVYTTAILG